MLTSLKPVVWLSLRIVLVAIIATPSVESGAADRPGKNKKQGRNQAARVRLPEISLSKTPVEMTVADLSGRSREQTKAAATRIDRAITDHLLENKQRPNPRTSDETFVRRIYLDLVGRIPTAEEAITFLADSSDNKRETLIDTLLVDPDYVSNFYNLWADVLRLTERPENNIIADPYLAYVKEAIRDNKPYDKWVYEMLTADGKIWQNPAVGYQLRDNGMPLPYVDNTVRVFLGTQIGCAQCHDHPFDEWTQHQFYELAAFTSGTQTRLNPRMFAGKKNPVQTLISQAKGEDLPRPKFGAFQRLVRANGYMVSENRKPLKLPHDYAYSDAEPLDVVQPAVLWGEIPKSAKNASRREQFAAWLTSPDNPAFSNMIANRIWHRLTGVGIVEPIDDFNDSNAPFSKALLEQLAEEVRANGFDLKQLVRAIVYTDAYQRTSSVYDRSSGTPYVFAGPTLRRMTAEQVWDSILNLTVYNSWPFQRPTADQIADEVDLDLANVSYEQAMRKANDYTDAAFGNLYRRKLAKDFGYQGMVLAKASELPTPLPASHFLRQFGQGDRSSINGNTDDATVPQILTMFNGPITHSMLEKGSRIHDEIVVADTPREAIDFMFLSVLTRMPDDEDRRIAAREIASAENRATAAGNVIWALLNTREFLFVR